MSAPYRYLPSVRSTAAPVPFAEFKLHVSQVSLQGWTYALLAVAAEDLMKRFLSQKPARNSRTGPARATSELAATPEAQSFIKGVEEAAAKLHRDGNEMINAFLYLCPVTQQGMDCVRAAKTAVEYTSRDVGINTCEMMFERTECVSVQFFSTHATQNTRVFVIAREWLMFVDAVMMVGNWRAYIARRCLKENVVIPRGGVTKDFIIDFIEKFAGHDDCTLRYYKAYDLLHRMCKQLMEKRLAHRVQADTV